MNRKKKKIFDSIIKIWVNVPVVPVGQILKVNINMFAKLNRNIMKQSAGH